MRLNLPHQTSAQDSADDVLKLQLVDKVKSLLTQEVHSNGPFWVFASSQR